MNERNNPQPEPDQPLTPMPQVEPEPEPDSQPQIHPVPERPEVSPPMQPKRPGWEVPERRIEPPPHPNVPKRDPVLPQPIKA